MSLVAWSSWFLHRRLLSYSLLANTVTWKCLYYYVIWWYFLYISRRKRWVLKDESIKDGYIIRDNGQSAVSAHDTCHQGRFVFFTRVVLRSSGRATCNICWPKIWITINYMKSILRKSNFTTNLPTDIFSGFIMLGKTVEDFEKIKIF